MLFWKKQPKSDSLIELHVNDSRDIVIPIMGPTGVGKSTFVNAVCGKETVQVGHTMESCTVEITSVQLHRSLFHQNPRYSWLQDREIYLVDTPGFDDTFKDDTEILTKIGNWLTISYKKHTLGGVIYLHDLSIDRFTGSARKNLIMFMKICGGDIFDRVALGATKVNKLDKKNADQRFQNLKNKYWHDILVKGVKPFELRDDTDSARSVVAAVLDSMARVLPVNNPDPSTSPDIISLAIQHELVDKDLTIPLTEAGKELRYTLKQILEQQKKFSELSGKADKNDVDAVAELREARNQIELLSNQLKTLKVPIGTRLRLFLQGKS